MNSSIKFIIYCKIFIFKVLKFKDRRKKKKNRKKEKRKEKNEREDKMELEDGNLSFLRLFYTIAPRIR